MVDKNIKVPIIQAHKDQRLCIDFVKNEDGDDSVTFTFEPDFDPENPTTPAQAAAVNIAQHIIFQFGLNKATEEEDEPSSPIIN